MKVMYTIEEDMLRLIMSSHNVSHQLLTQPFSVGRLYFVAYPYKLLVADNAFRTNEVLFPRFPPSLSLSHANPFAAHQHKQH